MEANRQRQTLSEKDKSANRPIEIVDGEGAEKIAPMEASNATTSTKKRNGKNRMLESDRKRIPVQLPKQHSTTNGRRHKIGGELGGSRQGSWRH